MRRTARVVKEGNSLRNTEVYTCSWILRLADISLFGMSDMRWVNLYAYEKITGRGAARKIIGDLDEKEP